MAIIQFFFAILVFLTRLVPLYIEQFHEKVYNDSIMKIRKAKISDVSSISALVNYYAEQDRMLYRSLAEIYENLQRFIVAEENSDIIGCCALQIIWKDLAEIKSLAVETGQKKKGIGKTLVEFAMDCGRNLGVKKVFVLTLEKKFFEKRGFAEVNKDTLPMKVWSDCAKCPKQDECDEIAMVKKM